jgi:hypothetical protein
MTLRFTSRRWRGNTYHDYYLDKAKVPGVTTILNAGIAKPFLVDWAARTVAEFVADHPDDVEALRRLGRDAMVDGLKSAHRTARDTAATRGTEIHKLADQIVHGAEVEVPEHLLGYVTGYVRWLEQFDVTPQLTERHIASRRWQYGGTFDLLGTFGRGQWAGRTPMLDLKSGSGVYGEAAIQLAAYARAEFYLDDNGDEQPMPDIDCSAVVHITDGETVMFPAAKTPAVLDEQFKLFTHVAFVARRVKWIGEQLGDPMHPDDDEIPLAEVSADV